MSLKKTLLVIGAVIGLLLPTGTLLRSQNPWNCFQFTYDESYFAQASLNWSEGRGYRMNGDALPFSPSITAGLPLAWGAHEISNLTGYDIPHAGRVFVHFCFLLILLSIAHRAFARERNWIAVPISLWFFGIITSKLTFGGYLTYGFLAEAPAVLLGSYAYYSLDRRRFIRAGLLATAVFLMKPTYLFFMPAVVLAAFRRSLRSAFIAGVTSLGTLVTGIYLLSEARGESIPQYLENFYNESRSISANVAPIQFIDYVYTLTPITIAVSVAFLVLGVLGLRRRKSGVIPLGQIAAFYFFAISIAYFLIKGHQPVSKQWSAIIWLAAAGFTVDWGNRCARIVVGWIPQESFRAVFFAVTVTFLLAVGQNAHHQFKRVSDQACNSKEQSAVNQKLKTLLDAGQVSPTKLKVIVQEYPASNFIYRLGFSPAVYPSWDALGKELPRWVAGETRFIYPIPPGCAEYWRGNSFSIAQCGRKN